MGDKKYLTSKCPNKSTSSILLLKSPFLWVLFFETLRLVNIDFSTPMKTIFCLKNLIYSKLKQT